LNVTVQRPVERAGVRPTRNKRPRPRCTVTPGRIQTGGGSAQNEREGES